MEKKILFAVDGSEKCNQALGIAGNLLKDRAGCHILLFHCLPELHTLFPEDLLADGSTQAQFERLGQAVLDSSRRVLVGSGFPDDMITVKCKPDSVVPSCDILNEAAASRIETVICGRRGRTPKTNLLIGSTSSRLSQYSTMRTVWVVDAPVHQTRKVLIPMEGGPDSRALTFYAAEFFAPIPDLEYTLLHFMPRLPSRFWDHGSILGREEEKKRRDQLHEWRSETLREVEKFLFEARDALIGCSVPPEKVHTRIVHTKEDMAKDMLAAIERRQYQFVLIGKKSFKEQKPFLLGSNANKILKNARNTILCLVDAC